MHICELVGVADPLGLDPQDGGLVDQVSSGDFDLNRSFERLWHGFGPDPFRDTLGFPNRANGLWTTIARKKMAADRSLIRTVNEAIGAEARAEAAKDKSSAEEALTNL